MTHTIVGVDIAKSVMQIHLVDSETGEIVNRPVKRSAFLEYFANRKPCLVGMESCGGSQHWARRLIEMGHQVKLMPAILIDTLREQWKGLDDVDRQICQIERRLREWMKDDQAAQAIAAIPGVGVLTATAAVATMGQANAFKSGREFAAWLGLVPGQTGSGGTIKLQGISKRGDTYLRTLLVHGARSIIYRVKQPGPWVEQMKQRRPLNVVIVAMANKLARIIWAMLAHQQPYRQDYARSKSA